MSSLSRDPRYHLLARQAAIRLGAHNDATIAGILALWQCEQPAPPPWPPVHNNPGNLTRHIGTLDGEHHRIATSSPGAGLLYVYDDPVDGANAFSSYLLRSSRYHGAIAAARAGNAHAFVHAITSHGYGTREGCAQDVLDRMVPHDPPAEHHRYVCAVRVARVRQAPHVGALVVGHHKRGDHVYGKPVSGGPYVAYGNVHHAWIQLGSHQYTAAGLYRRTP